MQMLISQDGVNVSITISEASLILYAVAFTIKPGLFSFLQQLKQKAHKGQLRELDSCPSGVG